MVDFGKAEVFEGKMPQAINRVVGSERPAADLLEEFAYRVGVQEESALGTQHSCR